MFTLEGWLIAVALVGAAAGLASLVASWVVFAVKRDWPGIVVFAPLLLALTACLALVFSNG
jgi:hypothetical protein